MSHGNGYPHPTVVAFSLAEGEQGEDPIRVDLDMEVRVNDTDNPCIFSHVDLVLGALKQYPKRSELPSPACGGSRNFDNEGNSSDDCSMPSAIYDSRHNDEENNNSGDGMFTAVSNVSVESELRSNASQAHPTTIEIMVTADDTYFDVDDNSDDDIEIALKFMRQFGV
jgi:hypothetical protein